MKRDTSLRGWQGPPQSGTIKAITKKGSQQAANVNKIVNKVVIAFRSRFSAAFFFHWEILPLILLTVTKGEEVPRLFPGEGRETVDSLVITVLIWGEGSFSERGDPWSLPGLQFELCWKLAELPLVEVLCTAFNSLCSSSIKNEFGEWTKYLVKIWKNDGNQN